MATPIEESNLAHIGSDMDHAAKKAAAEHEFKWEGAGEAVGIQIWRVENTRDEHGNPKFGIEHWPEERYGEFYKGDSYIVLSTTRDKEDDKLLYDVFFWIGSESTQDEYGVAAYKANELDDLLGDAPVQHREVESHESDAFLACFSGMKNGIKYLDGGISSGFRHVSEDSNRVDRPNRLFHIRRENHITRSYQVPLSLESLNHGDAFVLDTGKIIYTWYGESCSPFEKSKAAEIAHNITSSRHGKSTCEEDVSYSNEEFWGIFGGKGTIKGADEYVTLRRPSEILKTRMYLITEEDSFLKCKEIEVARTNLDSTACCLVDTGKAAFIWVGKEANKREQEAAMRIAYNHIKGTTREKNTCLVRVLEGKEKRTPAFFKSF